MPALSTGTYGKASPMATLTNFADRMTAALETGIGAVNDLNGGIATGAPVSQASVNTLLKVMQDLGAIATDARQAAMDEAAQAAQAAPDTSGGQPAAAGQTTPAKTGSGTASTSGSTTAKS